MRRKAFLSLISIVAAVPLVLGSAVVAQALPVSYADNPASREAMGFSTGFTSIAQSFTAKATGQLRSVTFTHVTYQAATASVSLWSFVGGVPSANLSTSNAVSTNAYGAKQYSFTTASVTAGTQYAFVFNGAPADYALLTSAGNAYTQGDLLLQANGAWTTSTAFDATFSTVINDSTTAPTLSGTPPTSLVQGSNVNFQFTVAGNPTPSVSLSSGQLPTGLTLSSTGLLSGTVTAAGSYSFTVAAGNGTFVDGVSTTAFLTRDMTVTTPQPGAPTISSATPGVRQVTVAFSAPAHTGSSPISSYRVTASNGTTCVAASASCAITGLANGAGYSFTVAALNASGWSPESAPVSATTWPLPAASVVTATAGDQKIDVSWTPSGVGGGPAISSYTVEYRSVGATTWSTRTIVSGTSTSFSGLSNGQGFEFRVSAANGVGSSPTSAIVSATPGRAPGPAVYPQGTGIAGGASLEWFPPYDEGGYPVSYEVQYRVGATGAWSAPIAVADRTTTVSGLTNGTAYQFQVRAVNAMGGSAWTDTNEITPGAAPTAPQGLTAVRSDETVALDWSAPASTNGFAVQHYLVEQRVGSGSWSPSTTDTLTTRSLLVQGLTNGETYEFRVAAVNERGTGAWAMVSGTPGAVPTAPLDATAAESYGAVTWSWSAPSDAGGFPVTAHTVRFRPVGGAWTTATIDATRSYTRTGLTNGQAYEFQVQATNAVGTGDYGQVIEATPGAAPSVVPGLTATRADSAVDLAWASPSDLGGFALDEYEVEYRIDGAWLDGGTTTSRTVTIDSLDNGTVYEFRVRAANERGSGPWSTPQQAMPASVASEPIDVTAAAADTQVTVSWASPVDLGGLAITDYELRSRIAGSSWGAPIAVGLPRSHTAVGLTNGTDYEFQVRAINEVGAGAWSDSIAETPFTTPSAPIDLTAAGEPEAVSLEWTAAAGNGRAVSAYLVEHRLVGDTSWVSPGQSVTDVAATVTGLVNGSAYEFRVTAMNVAGYGTASTIVTGTPADTAAAPESLVITAGDGVLGLEWAEPGDLGGFPVLAYESEYKLAGDLTWSTAPVTGLTTEITGLKNSSAYDVRVRAVSVIGAGAWASSSGTPFVFAPRFTDAAGASLAGSTVTPGTRVTLSGSGALPGERVQLVMHSTPVLLGSTTVAADGTYSLSASIPSNASVGAHRLVATMGVAGVTMADAEIAFSVIAADGLVVTGTDLGEMLTWSVLLVILGGLLVVRPRRRSHAITR